MIKITGRDWIEWSKPDSLKKVLIEKGPLAWYFSPEGGKHAVVLCGYLYDPTDSSTIWIFKNSMGLDWGQEEHGFGYIKNPVLPSPGYYIKTPILADLPDTLNTLIRDEDEDGYYWWGIGETPQGYYQDSIDCDDSNPFIGPYDTNYSCGCLYQYDSIPLVISSDTIWEEPYYSNRDIVIDSCRLTITDLVAMVENTRIIIKQGGSLILDGGTLTKACGGFWKGVEVWGDTSKSQLPYSNQGYIRIENGGKIECAEIGVLLGKREQDSLFRDGGGILQANDAIFLNNTTGVEFYPYKRVEEIHPQMCFFKNCSFVTYDSLYQAFTFNAFVFMREVEYIDFEGCDFEYKLPYQDLDPNNHGTGILAYNSSFHVFAGCKSELYPCPEKDSCKFLGLNYGIRAFNDGIYKSLNLEDSYFERNDKGIYLSGYIGPRIVNNKLFCNDQLPPCIKRDSIAQPTYGLYLDACNGYNIENNEFYEWGSEWLGLLPNIRSIGIYVKNSGIEANLLYNNNIHNLHLGIAAIGENRGDSTGLCIKCNAFTENGHDIFIFPDSISKGGERILGIAEYQGDPNDTTQYGKNLAGNTFSDYSWFQFTSYNMNNDKQCGHINYVHHPNQFELYLRPEYINDTTHVTRIEKVKTYIKAQSCPPTDEGLPELKSDFNGSKSEIASTQNELLLLTDGGDTEELNSDVVYSYPEEALEVRQQLLNDSPYLSDTVMKSAVAKEDVLPNAMVRDVLTVNPQSAKNDEILAAIDERADPMPAYMMGQIMQGVSSLGAKEKLEAKLNKWKQANAKAFHGILRVYSTDTNIVNRNDSIENFLISANTPEADYRLAFYYLNKGEQNTAISTINSISNNYNLTAYQGEIHQDYQAYFNTMKQLADNGLTIHQLDSSKKQTLMDIHDNDYPNIGAWARNTLIVAGEIDFTEPVYIKLPLKASYVDYPPVPDNIAYEESFLWIYPNPANSYCIVEYKLPETTNLTIVSIHELNGRFIKGYELNNNMDQFVLSFENFDNGIYIISLSGDGKTYETSKIAIQN